MVVPLLLATIGLASILMKRTLFGVILGIQTLFMAAAMAAAIGGFLSDREAEGGLLALFITLFMALQLVIGNALVIRSYKIKKTITLESLNELGE